MLSRRLHRIKTFQVLYAFVMQEIADLEKGKKWLHKSFERIYQLIVHQIDSYLKFIDFYAFMLEENKKKLLPTPEDLNPNLKFLHNPLIVHLQNNAFVQKEIQKFSLTWDYEIFRRIFFDVLSWKAYQAYMNSSEDSFDYHRKFAARLFKKKIAYAGLIKDFLESFYVEWGFDLNYTGLVVYGWMCDYNPLDIETTKVPPALKPAQDLGEISDLEFVEILFEKTILHRREFEVELQSILKNWDLERMLIVDRLLLEMAMTEFLFIPTIPPKVTIDEYIEIGETFGSDKSKVFINGILDQIHRKWKKEGRIRKHGAGLTED
ncbi:MAG: transcription antitermination protein NusB [Bacteroidales bacterium]|nr:transcription antitermination protein NusB [Bacteroidales bacterium]